VDGVWKSKSIAKIGGTAWTIEKEEKTGIFLQLR
jgi:hypothetical protein